MSDDVMTSHIPPILLSWERGTCHMKWGDKANVTTTSTTTNIDNNEED